MSSDLLNREMIHKPLILDCCMIDIHFRDAIVSQVLDELGLQMADELSGGCTFFFPRVGTVTFKIYRYHFEIGAYLNSTGFTKDVYPLPQNVVSHLGLY